MSAGIRHLSRMPCIYLIIIVKGAVYVTYSLKERLGINMK